MKWKLILFIALIISVIGCMPCECDDEFHYDSDYVYKGYYEKPDLIDGFPHVRVSAEYVRYYRLEVAIDSMRYGDYSNLNNLLNKWQRDGMLSIDHKLDKIKSDKRVRLVSWDELRYSGNYRGGVVNHGIYIENNDSSTVNINK